MLLPVKLTVVPAARVSDGKLRKVVTKSPPPLLAVSVLPPSAMVRAPKRSPTSSRARPE